MGWCPAWAARSLLRRQHREYEYVFTNGSLDIDVIYNKEWRKRLFSIDLRDDVILMARVSDQRHNRVLAEAVVQSVGKGEGGEGSYFLVVRENERETALVWDPSAAMAEACRKWAPRTVHL